MSIGSEVANLIIFLCIVCVPLAVGAVCIPIGRALADRIRSGQPLRGSDQDGAIHVHRAIDARLAALEQATANNAIAIEHLAARRLPGLPSHHAPVTPRAITPH